MASNVGKDEQWITGIKMKTKVLRSMAKVP